MIDNLHAVLEFLSRNQPLPGDDVVSKQQLAELDQVRRFLRENPNRDALELLLGVFGDGDGFGVYQLIEDTVAAHDKSDVVRTLTIKLSSGPESVQYWCSQIAASYPDEALVPGLATALKEGSYDLRFAAVTALESIGTEGALLTLRSWRISEQDQELRKVIDEVLDGR